MTPTKPKSSRAGALWFALFALPFAGAGVAAFVWSAADVLAWQHMRTWTAVPAQVLSAELEEHSGDDSTTYEAQATYRYGYAGQDYTSTRVAIGSGADNIGDFQRDLYRQLRAAQQSGAPVTAYIDPENPNEAVINRELRWGLLSLKGIFAVLFGGVGFAMLFGARYGAKQIAAEHALRTRYPREPWRWRREWADGRIAGSARTAAYAALGFALFWNLVSLPAAVFIPGEIASGNTIAALGLLFPLVGIGLATWAVRAWLRLRRFKEATLVLARLPVAPGGRLKGAIRIEAEVPVTSHFRLELVCSEESTHGNRRNRERNERLVWQKEWRVPRHQCQIGSMFTSVPVDVAVPADQPPTSSADDARQVSWRLDVTGECPGPDFWSRFELPVFAVDGERLAASDNDAADAPTVAANAPPPDPGTLAALGIRYERLPQGGEAWTFRRGQHKSVAFGVTLFALASLVGAVLLWRSNAPIVIVAAVAAFDALFVYWALSLWLTEYRVTLVRGVLTLACRGLLARTPKEIPLQWIRSVRAKRGMQAGNKLYYDLKVETADGTHTAAGSVADYDVASWLAQHWMAAPERVA